MTIEHKGRKWNVREEFIEALANMGSDVAEGVITSDEAVEQLLEKEGYNHEAVTQTAEYWNKEYNRYLDSDEPNSSENADICWNHIYEHLLDEKTLAFRRDN